MCRQRTHTSQKSFIIFDNFTCCVTVNQCTAKPKKPMEDMGLLVIINFPLWWEVLAYIGTYFYSAKTHLGQIGERFTTTIYKYCHFGNFVFMFTMNINIYLNEFIVFIHRPLIAQYSAFTICFSWPTHGHSCRFVVAT